MREDFVNNGPDRTLGNFEDDRIQRMIDIVAPILAGLEPALTPGLQPSDLYSNEFVVRKDFREQTAELAWWLPRSMPSSAPGCEVPSST